MAKKLLGANKYWLNMGNAVSLISGSTINLTDVDPGRRFVYKEAITNGTFNMLDSTSRPIGWFRGNETRILIRNINTSGNINFVLPSSDKYINLTGKDVITIRGGGRGEINILNNGSRWIMTASGDEEAEGLLSVTTYQNTGSTIICTNYASGYTCNQMIINGSLVSVSSSITLTNTSVLWQALIIGEYCFSGVTALTGAYLSDNVKSINRNAFYYCTNLSQVHIGSGVTYIGEGAFYGCSSLTSVTIPSSMKTISSNAFSYCTNLSKVYYLSTTAKVPSLLPTEALSPFSNTNVTYIYCLDGSYKLSDGTITIYAFNSEFNIS